MTERCPPGNGSPAPCLMFQGTSSNVGKSLMVAALARILHQDGFRVAPFKSQNMALNSGVTPDGLEMGRAQVVQARAAGIAPRVEMNPILLKPKGDLTAQVVVMGRPLGDMGAREYRESYVPEALGVIRSALDSLRSDYELILIEGAGSPAEVNLKERDIANMKVAEMASAPVVLVADIDRGGVFAQIVGTLELLELSERERVKGFIINKFRGDLSLLEPGLRWLEERTGKPVFGVVPYLKDLGIEEEDSMALAGTEGGEDVRPEIDLVVIRLPRISNFTDFDLLRAEPRTRVRYIRRPSELATPDAVILPGTKNTVDDLLWLRREGLELAMRELAARGTAVVGICGGYQMLGARLIDPEGSESDRPELDAIGLLDASTTFFREKRTVWTRAFPEGTARFFPGREDFPVDGYEIHTGRTVLGSSARPAFRTSEGGEGAVAATGEVWGTYFHGLFDNDGLRRAWIDHLRAKKGLPALDEPVISAAARREKALNRLAQTVRESLDIPAVMRLAGRA